MTDQTFFTIIASAIATLTTGAMIIVIRLFLKAMREERESFQGFLENHMSDNTRAMERLAGVVGALVSESRYTRMAVTGAVAKDQAKAGE